MYALVGGAIAYASYRRGRVPLISSVFRTLFGARQTDGFAGKVVDIFAIIATLFGTAATLGLAAIQIGEGVQIVDPYTGELRVPTRQDVADTAKAVDALPNVDVYERAVAAEDVDQRVAHLYQAEAWMTNTSKHGFMGSGNGYLSGKLLEMAAAVVGGKDKLRERPIISFITCPVSPLKLVKDTCEIIMAAARGYVAVNILSMAMAGGSSPVTLAGTLVTHYAEVLAGLTLSQLTRPGAAVVYGSSTTAMDLRLASASVGSPECGLISAAVAQIARFYLLPSWVAGA